MTKTTALRLRWFPIDDPQWQPDGPLLALVIIQNVLGELRRTVAAYGGGKWEGDRYVGGRWEVSGIIRWIPRSYGLFEPPPPELVDRKWLHKMWPTF